MNRRELLKILIGLSLSAGRSLTHARSAGKRPPNILLVLTDDQSWETMGFTGRFPFLKTPNIDRLATEGTVFPNAFVTSSVCSSNRATLLTGCYTHRHGVIVNDTTDPLPHIPLFPQLLQKSGYETALVGKWHMKPTAEPRPGFNYWVSFATRGNSVGKYENPTLNENGRELISRGYITDLLTDYACGWLRERKRSPFCLILSHLAPHSPVIPAKRHRRAFPDAEMPKPPSFDDTLEGKPAWQRHYVLHGLHRNHWWWHDVPKSIPKRKWRPSSKRRLDYFRTLLAVDESLGQVLSTLEQLGELDDTMIVFTSDNGFMLGAHRMKEKYVMYEESIRVPLIVRYPRLVSPGTLSPQMVASVDIAPTLLQATGNRIPPTMQGQPVFPSLEHKTVDSRQILFYEYFHDSRWPGVPTTLGVRTRRWKYIHYPELVDDIDELYDLEDDPHELRNLISDPAYSEQLRKMKAELIRQKKETEYEHPPSMTRYDFTWTSRRLLTELEALTDRVKRKLKPFR